MYAMLINNVAQVMNPVHAEGAFFQVGVELVLPQGVQNLLNIIVLKTETGTGTGRGSNRNRNRNR
jgi:hypothetical protein